MTILTPAAADETNFQVCADCGSSAASWASLNRGVLICSECCYVHRNLGRQISQIRSLTRGLWHGSQLNLVNTLYRSGANNIWEHSLIVDAQHGIKNKWKPVSNDPIVPRKEAFITAKYVQHAFTIQPQKNDASNCCDDFSRQLWSCARTAHVETSLRLLALGASPNYVDPLTGNSPFHIAAREGQHLQIELLWIYGADICLKNFDGQTAFNLARSEGNYELSERLLQLEFEVTDRLSNFLCGKRPDHKSTQHFFIPDMVGPPPSESLIAQRRLIQTGSGIMLERLAQDVYDEVDRRELNAQWPVLVQQNRFGILNHVAIFLPPNPKLTATRNQMRQKIAKFDFRDLSRLIIDLLKEVRRRYYSLPLDIDDDNAAGLEIDDGNLESRQSNGVFVSQTSFQKNRISNHTKHSSSGKTAETDDCIQPTIALDNYLELKEKYTEMNQNIEVISRAQTELQKSLKAIENSIGEIQLEQHQMRTDLEQGNRQSATYPINDQSRVTCPEVGAVLLPSCSSFNHRKLDWKPRKPDVESKQLQKSATTTIAAQMPTSKNLSKRCVDDIPLTSYNKNVGSRNSENGVFANPPSESSTIQHRAVNNLMDKEEFEMTLNFSPFAQARADVIASDSIDQISSTNQTPEIKELFNEDFFPDNLILETELLTTSIKNLLAELQQPNSAPQSKQQINITANAVFHADSINHHIVRILNLIPLNCQLAIQHAMAEMEASMRGLNRKCLSRPLDTNETCEAAYNVARAAKKLLMAVNGKEVK